MIGLEEGAAALQITKPPYQISEIAWTPDGSTLLFNSRIGEGYDREVTDRHVYAIAADGTGEARKLSPEGYAARGATASPDGSRVAFYARLSKDLNTGDWRIYTASMTGEGLTQIGANWGRTFTHIGLSDMPAPGGESKLTWSPDGSALYTLTSVNGAVHLVRVNVATSEVATLVGGDRQVYPGRAGAERAHALLRAGTGRSPCGRVGDEAAWLPGGAPWIDPDRLGVTGGSYGGYMTNWIVSHTDRFKAAVTGRSICDWRTVGGTGDIGTWLTLRFGPAPWIDDTKYKQQSPITYVENVTTPILIEHQEGDLRCPIDQGMIWYSAIKHLGRAPVRFVTYPDEFHGMSRNGKPYNRIHRLGEIVSWFQTHLQG